MQIATQTVQLIVNTQARKHLNLLRIAEESHLYHCMLLTSSHRSNNCVGSQFFNCVNTVYAEKLIRGVLPCES